MCDSWMQLKWIKILSQKKHTVVSNELLCLFDINIDLFLWVLVRKKKSAYSLSGISLSG